MNEERKNGARYWIRALRSHTELSGAAQTLAMAAGHLCDGTDAGLFLLDEAKRHLLLVASWSAHSGCREEDRRAIPVHTAKEPLCFCLQRGEAYRSTAAATFGSDAVRLLRGDAGAGESIVLPLTGRGGLILGGVLVVHGPAADLPPDTIGELELLCDYAAALLEGFLRDGQARVLLRSLQEDLTRLEEQSEQEQALARRLIGESAPMRRVRTLILRAAPADATVLLTGETGTGKEVAAAAIHAFSPRAKRPFIKINCAALPASLLESELFGHKRGAFSGADKDHEGLVTAADGGTLLLDEIGDIEPTLQAKLLRFLQDGEVRPVGSSQAFPVRVRVIAATNRDLHAAMREGSFRPDLYHRLATFHIALPPLRERREDIAPLTAHFLALQAEKRARPVMRPDPAAMLALCAHDFPGNVRELAACVERAVLLAEPEERSPTMADFFLRPEEGANTRGLAELLAAYEAELLSSTLTHCDDNVTRAAEVLRIPRSTLKSKIRKFKEA